MRKTIFTLLLPAALSTGIALQASAQKVYDVANNGKIDGGISLILPRVSYMIEVPVLTTTYKQGLMLKQGDEFLAQCIRYGANRKACTELLLKKSNDASYSEYAIQEDSIRLTPLSTPDYTKAFYIDPKKKWYANQTLSFTYGTDGMITDASMTYENKSYDLVMKGVGGLIGLVGNFVGLGKGPGNIKGNEGKIKELEDILKKIDSLTNSADDIDMYKERIAKLEKKYAAAFAKYFYTAKLTVKTTKILIIPAAKNNTPAYGNPLTYQLFSLDKTNGKIIINNNPSVTADVIWYKNAEVGTIGNTAYTLQVSLLSKSVQATEHFDSRPNNTTYMPYNVPAKTDVKLIKKSDKGEDILYHEMQDMPQFGIVAYLKNPKNKKNIQYDPLTGAIKKIDIESKAISTDNIGAAADLLDKGIKMSLPKTENQKMKEEVERLDLLIQLRDKKEELGIEE